MISPQVPSLYVQSRGEKSVQIALQITRAPTRYVIRLTGGCGNMAAADGKGLIDLFVQAFGRDFSGALLFGGSRMLRKDNPHVVVPSITEVAPAIHQNCPHAVTLGVIPKTRGLRLSDWGMIVSEDSTEPFFTIVHPHQDLCLVVQPSSDEYAGWEAEYEECAEIMGHLRRYAAWQSLLICYNGGAVTEKELLFHAQRAWPVLLVADSGRVSTQYAADQEFLTRFSNVQVAAKSSSSIRQKLIELGAIQKGGTAEVAQPLRCHYPSFEEVA